MIIYTAIFSDYEKLKEPMVITPGWRYVCYTDQPFTSNVWEIVSSPSLTHNDPIRHARAFKILPLDIECDKSIYIDGSFSINCDLNEYWAKHFRSPMTVISHPIRQDIYDEAIACIRNGRGNERDIGRQISKYKSEGMPEHNGLIQSGIILRENTEQVRLFCKLWFEQIALSTRDQLGFAYAEWVSKIKWPRIEWDYRKGQEFIFTSHHKNKR